MEDHEAHIFQLLDRAGLAPLGRRGQTHFYMLQRGEITFCPRARSISNRSGWRSAGLRPGIADGWDFDQVAAPAEWSEAGAVSAMHYKALTVLYRRCKFQPDRLDIERARGQNVILPRCSI